MSRLIEQSRNQGNTTEVAERSPGTGSEEVTAGNNPLDPLVAAAIGVQGQFGDALRNLLPRISN